jgi:hypothetical protein
MDKNFVNHRLTRMDADYGCLYPAGKNQIFKHKPTDDNRESEPDCKLANASDSGEKEYINMGAWLIE